MDEIWLKLTFKHQSINQLISFSTSQLPTFFSPPAGLWSIWALEPILLLTLEKSVLLLWIFTWKKKRVRTMCFIISNSFTISTWKSVKIIIYNRFLLYRPSLICHPSLNFYLKKISQKNLIFKSYLKSTWKLVIAISIQTKNEGRNLCFYSYLVIIFFFS